jgi:hypothetical protein
MLTDTFQSRVPIQKTCITQRLKYGISIQTVPMTQQITILGAAGDDALTQKQKRKAEQNKTKGFRFDALVQLRIIIILVFFNHYF